MTSRNNAATTRGRPFAKGNPGRPRGARHKTTMLAEKLMQEDAKAIVEAVLTAARSGDMTAARIVLDRICPPHKDRPVMFSLPEINSPADASAAMAGILAAVATGEITPGEAQDVAGLIDAFRKSLELTELQQRIVSLEKGQEQR